ncbi:MAG TPA: hypothetical protein VEK75_04995, partial [Xanthobacteraceae bacterium]|nr:hypothetical protein [Xanthobacteraceae bacterium]
MIRLWPGKSTKAAAARDKRASRGTPDQPEVTTPMSPEPTASKGKPAPAGPSERQPATIRYVDR